MTARNPIRRGKEVAENRQSQLPRSRPRIGGDRKAASAECSPHSPMKSATAVRLQRTKTESTKAEVVTAAELSELAALEKKYADACKQMSGLERLTKSARLSLAQKVLGVESEEQFKRLDPETLEELMAVREERGYWR